MSAVLSVFGVSAAVGVALIWWAFEERRDRFALASALVGLYGCLAVVMSAILSVPIR